jgi:hypothetical protein
MTIELVDLAFCSTAVTVNMESSSNSNVTSTGTSSFFFIGILVNSNLPSG